jgi:cell wall-associated NlpC family hydrolase
LSTLENAVIRARNAASEKTRYILGAGGRRPLDLLPHGYKDGKMGCDCSGFVCWCLGLSRYEPKRFPLYDGWQNTDSIVADAMGAQKLWRSIPFPIPGAAIIYPGLFKDGRRVSIGHMGLVIHAEQVHSLSWREKANSKKIIVIDCASAWARRVTGYAIAERDISLWAKRKDSVIAIPTT